MVKIFHDIHADVVVFSFVLEKVVLNKEKRQIPIKKTAYLVARLVAQKNPPKIRIAEFRGTILDIRHK